MRERFLCTQISHAKVPTLVSEFAGATPRDVKQHKANFRCALNSLRDVKELQNMNKQKGDDAYKVYQMLPKVSKKKNTSVYCT